MLQAFCDESAQNNGGLFVMAGYVAPVEAWLRFREEWRAVLDLNAYPYRPIKSMKMRKLTHERGLRRAEMFYRVIERHVLTAFSVRFNLTAMKLALARAEWPQELIDLHSFASPYYFAFRLVTEGVAKTQQQLGITEPVNFVFDEHTSHTRCIKGWERFRNSSQPFARYVGAPPVFRRDEEYLPLQAADLYAWWVRKWAVEGVDEDGVRDLKFPWTSRDIPRFHWIYEEADFLSDFDEELAGLKAMFPEDAAAMSSGKEAAG